MQKKEMTLSVEKLSHEGRGIAHCEDKTIFVTGALPQEQVSVQPLRKKQNTLEAVSKNIIENPHPDRVVPVCQHYLVCGGCNLQHLAPKAQLQFKHDTLFEHLSHHIDINKVAVLAPTDSPAWHYRTKARLGVKWVAKKEKIVVGFRELINPRFLADIQNCPVLDKSLSEALPKIGALISELSQPNQIPQIEIAVGDEGTVLIIRHLFLLTESDLEKLRDFQKQHGFILFSQSKGPDTIKPIVVGAPAILSYTLKKYGLCLQFRPQYFTQVNQHINPILVDKAIELLALKDDDRVLDLFCGLGNFSLAMATIAQTVVGVEGSMEMANFAKHNAVLNQIKNADFYAYDLTQPLDNLPWLQKPYSKLLLDPPRSGAPEICESIERFQVERIVYVSCNPITFARDASILVKKGYRMTDAGVFNMFPNTAHVESIGCFELQ